MILDKSSEPILDDDLTEILEEIEQDSPNIILCTDVFDKMKFLNRLINNTKIPIVFVDVDLLYSGYVRSGMIRKKENVEIFHIDKTNWNSKFVKIINKIVERKTLVIVDSFNGIYCMFENLESVIFVNSCIMLLSSLGKQKNSPIMVTGIAKNTDNGKLALSPNGHQIIKSRKTKVFALKRFKEMLFVNTLDDKKQKRYEIKNF